MYCEGVLVNDKALWVLTAEQNEKSYPEKSEHWAKLAEGYPANIPVLCAPTGKSLSHYSCLKNVFFFSSFAKDTEQISHFEGH